MGAAATGKTKWTSTEITRELRDRMRTGALRPRQRIGSQKELSEEFGVCQATIQKSLKELQRDGLLWSRPGLGRFVAEAAAGGRTNLLGVVLFELEHLAHPVITQRLAGIKDVAGEAGSHLAVFALNSARPADRRAASHPDGVDGIIIIAQEAPPEAADSFGRKAPVVWMDRPPEFAAGVSVSLDYLDGGFAAARHLIELGHRRLAVLTPRQRFHVGREQYDGMRLAVQNLGGRRKVHLQAPAVEGFSEDEGYRAARELLGGEPPPSSLVCGSDELARGALRAIDEAGLRVPDDVSLVGWNDTIAAGEAPVALTTVHMDFHEAGRLSARTLLEMIERPRRRHEDRRVAAELIVRDSTAAPRRRARSKGSR